jgi:hypothetical protein
MAKSPWRPTLYRITTAGAILLSLWVALQAQVAKRPQVSKGPRALGLIELTRDGKQQLIPIAIMVNGKFYDASAYKADPVPMALEPQTVYEGVKAGVSQGLFTVTTPGQLGSTWLGRGVWESVEARKAAAVPKEPAKPRQDPDARPILRRGGSKPKTEETPAPSPDTQKKSEPPAKPPAPQSEPSQAKTQPPDQTKSPQENPPAQEDPNRPVLRRGKPTAQSREEISPPPVAKSGSGSSGQKAAAGQTQTTVKHEAGTATTDAKKEAVPAAKSRPPQFIAAISDASGPDLNPYTYQAKPEEEQAFRKKMQSLAAAELAKRNQPGTPEPKKLRTGKPAMAAEPKFEDVDLQVFDIANSNEPILVFSADGHQDAPDGTSVTYYITLVARSDINGDLRKLFSQITDTKHLDAFPRLQLIDAVDADGDGRGDLLFREISDNGQGYIIYRVSADVLWKMYDSLGG